MTKDFIKAVLAGIFIAIGGTVYLSLYSVSKIAGATAFTIGLFMICVFKLNLFTGKVGYLARCKKEEVPKYLLFLLSTFIGNIIGTALSATLLKLTRLKIAEAASAITEIKLGDGTASIFILAIFCGMLMFTAVECFARINDSFGKYLALLFCVSVFILCGFEHCIANMFYYALAGKLFSLEGLSSIVVIALGNTFGALCFSLPLFRVFEKQQ
ncbi:MAG: formate/nitrite transporter family protein [Clostridiaceae bacterium]|nr:formate/nitrite transporter family protein [Clostridiaceae bacterium]